MQSSNYIPAIHEAPFDHPHQPEAFEKHAAALLERINAELKKREASTCGGLSRSKTVQVALYPGCLLNSALCPDC